MNALEERETQEDALMTEELDSDEEVKYFSIITKI